MSTKLTRHFICPLINTLLSISSQNTIRVDCFTPLSNEAVEKTDLPLHLDLFFGYHFGTIVANFPMGLWVEIQRAIHH
jgi:hypothetical protein